MHPLARKAGKGSVSRRAKQVLASGGYAVGADKSPFSSAGQQARRGKAAEELSADGAKSKSRFARGGKTKAATHIAIHIHPRPHPMMGAPGAAPMAAPMAGPPGAPPPGIPMGGPPPGMGGPSPPGLAQGLPPGMHPPGMMRGGAATGVGRLESAEWQRRHHSE
jgi:hypothetical protein